MHLHKIIYFRTLRYIFARQKHSGRAEKEFQKSNNKKYLISLSARPECPVRGVSKGLILFLLTFFTISLGQSTPRLITCTATDNDPYTKEITITFTVPKKDFIYKDFITCSIDDPAIHLSSWKADKQSIAHYDSSFKEAKQVFNENFTITMTASSFAKATEDKQAANKPLTNLVHLYCSYYRKSEKKINHTLFPLLFTAPTQASQEYSATTMEIIENNTIPRTIKKSTYLDNYIFTVISLAHTVITSLHTDHKKYFALLIFLIIVLFVFSYIFKKELATQIKIKELIKIIVSLLILASITYLILCLYSISTPLITLIMACFCSLCAGFFYIKKSTELQSARLRTFCTFIGILCICCVLFLSFKIVQYTDEQFNLLQ